MKVLEIIMTVLLLTLVLSGCDKLEPLSPKSPDALIAPPLSNQERAQQKRMIMEKLSTGETLTVPEDMENPTAFLVDDFNHDGKEEILAFYHNSNAYEQGFIILTESDTEPGVWDEVQRVTEVGSEVKRFEAIDMDGDGQKEILFGVKGYTKENLLYCYTYINGQWQKLGRIEYDALRLVEREAGNFLIVMLRDTVNSLPTSQINIYSFVQDDYEPIINRFEATVDGYCVDAVYGRFSALSDGIGLVMRHNEYYTVALFMQEGSSYRQVMDEPLAYGYAANDQVEIFKDINNDGVMEICYLQPPANRTDNSHDMQEYLRIWYQWQEQVGPQAVQAVLGNVNEGFEFYVPPQWIEQVEYEFSRSQGVDWIDFYRTGSAEAPRLKLFSIAAIDRYTWEQEGQLPKEQMIVLGNNPNKKKVYAAILEQLPEDIQITENQLIACLSIIGGK